MIKIILDNGQELTCEGNFEVTKRVADISDISKRSSSYSKTLTIVGSKANIQVLNGYFDVNLVASTFNHEAKYRCVVEVNGSVVEEKLIFQLTGINKKSLSHSTEDESISFAAVVYNDAASFYQQLGSKLLEELQINTPTDTHTLTLANVQASYDHDVTDKYVYLLPYKDDSTYYLNQFILSLFAKTIFDAIFESNGYTYTWDELSNYNIRFDELLIPFTGKYKQGSIAQIQDSVIIGQNPNLPDGESPIDTSLPTWTYFQHCGTPVGSPNITQIYDDAGAQVYFLDNYPHYEPVFATLGYLYRKTIGVEVADFKGQYDTTTGIFRPALNAIYDFEISYDWTFGIECFTANGCELVMTRITSETTPKQVTYGYLPFVMPNNAYIHQPAIGSEIIFNDGDTINFGVNTVSGTTTTTITENYDDNDLIYTLGMRQFIKRTVLDYWEWQDQTTNLKENVETTFEITNITVKITPRATYADGVTVDLNDFLPKKIKQADFVKSIMNLYNCYIDVDEDDTNNLIIKTRQKYYDDGETKDFSKYLDTSKDSEITFLSNENAKIQELGYKDDKDIYNEAYKGSTQKTYGDVRYILANEHIKGTERKELIFSPTPYAKNQFGAYLPCLNTIGSSENNIRLLLWNGKKDVVDGVFKVLNSNSEVLSASETYYPQALHQNDPLNPSFDLNFGICVYYFAAGVQPTINTMFAYHYRELFVQLNSGKKRVSTFVLPERERVNLKLSDTIVADNTRYIIDSIVNNYGVSKETKLTLLTIDNDNTLVVSQPPLPVGLPASMMVADGEINNVVSSKQTAMMKESNNINVGGSSMVIGEGNTLAKGVNNAIIIGNNNLVMSDNVFVLGSDKEVTKNGIYADDVFIGERSMFNELQVNGKTIYHIVANQTGTNPLTVEDYVNEFDTITLTYVSTGKYKIDFNETLPDNVELIINESNATSGTPALRIIRGEIKTDSIFIYSFDNTATLANDLITDIHIRLVQYG